MKEWSQKVMETLMGIEPVKNCTGEIHGNIP
jgi:hypothetical protein